IAPPPSATAPTARPPVTSTPAATPPIASTPTAMSPIATIPLAMRLRLVTGYMPVAICTSGRPQRWARDRYSYPDPPAVAIGMPHPGQASALSLISLPHSGHSTSAISHAPRRAPEPRQSRAESIVSESSLVEGQVLGMIGHGLGRRHLGADR